MPRRITKDRRSKDNKYKKDFLFRRRKFCKLCDQGIAFVDYKNIRLLMGFLRERAKISPRRVSGTCAIHQRQLTNAIKRARHLALLPFTTD